MRRIKGKGRNDFIGQRGEGIFQTEIAQFGENGWPYFDPIFLGEKREAVDYLVELVRFPSREPNISVQPYFFVQVKATSLGYTHRQGNPRLKVRLSERNVERIKHYQAPTYLVGVDEPGMKSYVVAIDERIHTGISSISTMNPLNDESVLKRLWDEVGGHWMKNNSRMKESAFSN